MRAIITFGGDFPEDARDELEAAVEGDSQVTHEGLVAMLQNASDVQVMEIELLD